MTNRVNAFIVVLEKDIREDDAEPILIALKHIRGVLTVKPQIADGNEAVAESRVKAEIRDKLFDLLRSF